MNVAWAASIEQLWRSPNAGLWITLAVAGIFAVVVLVALLRAERTVAHAALAVIALLAIGTAVALGSRGNAPDASSGRALQVAGSANIATPALACLDDLAGEAVLTACEQLLFGSPDVIAAAVSATAARIARLTALGDVATADRLMTPDLAQLRRSIERDRYGLVAYVLAERDRCQPGQCPAFQALTDHNQISANMGERVYESMIGRYAASWNVPAVAAAPSLAGLPATVPSGKPTTADFPTANSIPPVTIMTPEPAAPPPAATASRPPAAPAPPAAVAAPRAPSPPAAANAQLAPRQAAPPAAAKKPPPPPPPKRLPSAPVQLAPAAANEDN